MFDSLATVYRDPLFGIVILISMIVIIAFADYGRNRYRAKKRDITLENFTKSYHGSTLDDELIEFLHLAKNPIPPLLLLAKTYAKAGDSAQAIKIYLNLLDTTHSPQEKIIILESLSITYFEAGFLQRAKHIFLEILQTYPRNTHILHYLMRTYESMGEYQSALDTLECLDELGEAEPLKHIKNYLHFMLLSQNSLLPLDKKHNEIIALMRYSKQINRLALEYLFTYARDRFWEELLGFSSITFCLDILWRCKQEEVPFTLLSNRLDILYVFMAKGFLAKSSAITQEQASLERVFALDVLDVLDKHSRQKGDLSFEYRCTHCKHVFPFDAYRCQMCAHIGEMDLIYNIIQGKRT